MDLYRVAKFAIRMAMASSLLAIAGPASAQPQCLYANEYLAHSNNDELTSPDTTADLLFASSRYSYHLGTVTSGVVYVSSAYTGPLGTELQWSTVDELVFVGSGALGAHGNQYRYVASGAGTLHMQGDGNLVLYDGSMQDAWQSYTNGNSGAYLCTQNDANLVIYSSGHTPLWSIW